MRQDLTYALRTLRKNLGFTAVVVISIALGIAANTTVFSITNTLLLGEIPVREPDRLVSFGAGKTLPWLDYVDYRDGTKEVFEEVSAFLAIVPASIGGKGEPERVWGQLATGNYFRTIGVEPVLGRGFRADEDEVPGRNPVVVLSHGLWTRRFGADAGIIGRDILLNGYPYKVIGIAPPGFSGAVRAIVSDFWAPLAMVNQLSPDINRDRLAASRDAQWLCVNGRLRPGVSKPQATAAVNVIQQRIDEQFRKGKNRREPLKLTRAGELINGLGRVALSLTVVLTVVVGLVLLIACANVANVLLARATGRRKEIGVRLAMGASRARLIRQLLTESVLLSCLGAAVGFSIAWWAARAISAFRPPFPIPIALDFTPDLRVFVFTAGLAVVTGIVFGLAPALRATHPELTSSLKDTATAFGGHRRFGLRNALVVTQVALSMVLLVGAMLFLRSLQNASSIDIGMRADGVALVAFDPKLNHYTPERTKILLAQLRERAGSLPGVTGVTFLDSIPLSIGGTTFGFEADSGRDGLKRTEADVYNVGSGYFRTMGVPIIGGREFDNRADRDGGVAIVNQTLAAKLFGTANPLGREMKAEGKIYRIVGLAKNAKSRTIGEDSAAVAYLYLEAAPEQVMSFYGITVAAKGTGDPASTLRAVREELRTLDPNLPVFNASTMREHLDKALLLPRVCALLLGVFGTTGLVLAILGLYGVMSYAVRSRTKEIGIRMALGAEQRGVLRMVTKQGMGITGVGLISGVILSLGLSRFVASFLYGVSGTDLFTFVAVPAALLLIALAAVLVPARKAARVDPLVALRYE